MADRSGSPIAVKMEESPQSVILTYFQGDIGSMVDQHFARALSRICKAKTPAGKSKKIRKSMKSEESNSCQWNAAPATSYSELQFQSLSGRLQLSSSKESQPSLPLPLSPAEDSPGSWPPFSPRQAGGLGLPTITYSHGMPPEGLGLTGQQYATSLLNLLHNDRPEMGPSMAKPELLPSWTPPPGFRDHIIDPGVGLDPGRALDKKDLYWY